MKLHNKKTDEIVDFQPFRFYQTDSCKYPSDIYESLSALNDEWEDYNPKESLIKDKNIREAVRTWAKMNKLEKVEVEPPTVDCAAISFSYGMLRIDFYLGRSDISYGEYSIDELCGKEEQ